MIYVDIYLSIYIYICLLIHLSILLEEEGEERRLRKGMKGDIAYRDNIYIYILYVYISNKGVVAREGKRRGKEVEKEVGKGGSGERGRRRGRGLL